MSSVRRIAFMPGRTYKEIPPGVPLEQITGMYIYVLYPSGYWNWYYIGEDKTRIGISKEKVPTWVLMLLMLAL